MTTSDEIVITGIGLVSPIGLTTQHTFNALIEGESGVRPLAPNLAERANVQVAAVVKQFDGAEVVGPREARRMSRSQQLAVAAARQAKLDAWGSSQSGEYDQDRVGVVIGSAFGGLPSAIDACNASRSRGMRGITPFQLVNMITNVIPGAAVAAHVTRSTRAGRARCPRSHTRSI
jgi:3-oxoacyl-[acyl-carrier-protein] synthase II